MRTIDLAGLRQDIAYAVRMLARTPGFTAVAVLALALGIGANSAIFSVVHGVLLAPLPFRDADRLYQVRMLYPDGTAYGGLSAPDFMSVREGTRVFERVEAYSEGIFTLLGTGEPREVRGARVSDGLFDLLGLRVTLGRPFVPGENTPGRGNVAILDHGFWQRELGGDPNALGRSVSIGGNPYTIVGVLAPDAGLTDDVEMYLPLEYDDTFAAATAKARRNEYLGVYGRVRPGIDSVRIDEDLRRLGTQLQATFRSTNEGLTFNARSLRDTIVGDVRTPLLVLFGAVACVLLVACANVANLLLARGSARRGELAVRAALGAGRGRLVRQLLTESALLGVGGGSLGLLIAYWGTRAVVAAQPADIPRLDQVGVNGTVVVFTLALSLIASLAFGTLPAIQATGRRLASALRESARGGDTGAAGHRVRASLVVAEMALAVVLLTGAGLLIRSFVGLTRVDPGFRPAQAMAFRITLQGDAYKDMPQVRARVGALEQRLRALPGVTAVASTTTLPLSGLGALNDFQVEGAPPPPPDVNQEIAVASVTPEYFKVVGAPLVRGRLLTDRDDDQAPRVALINEAAARRWFPGQDPIDKFVVSGTRRQIVGIVADILQRTPGQPAAPQLFVPYGQRTTRAVRMVVRTNGDPLTLGQAIRAEIRGLDPNLAIARFTPLDQLVATSIARPRFYTALLALFAGVALALAATGIFGVMSYAVAQRAHEISIRMALGAHRGDVLRLIVGRAVALAALGLVLGFAGSLLLGRAIEGQLFGVTLLDPVTLGVVALVLGASAALASFLPARRAVGLDPTRALRES